MARLIAESAHFGLRHAQLVSRLANRHSAPDRVSNSFQLGVRDLRPGPQSGAVSYLVPRLKRLCTSRRKTRVPFQTRSKPCPLIRAIILRPPQPYDGVQHVFAARGAALRAALPRRGVRNDAAARAAMRQRPTLYSQPAVQSWALAQSPRAAASFSYTTTGRAARNAAPRAAKTCWTPSGCGGSIARIQGARFEIVFEKALGVFRRLCTVV